MAKRKKPAPRKRAAKKHRVSRGEGARLVRGIRRRLKLTQAALADRLGMAQMSVSRWESGEAPVRPSMRLALNSLQPLKVKPKPKASKKGK
jgi:transcriptional regulator with XRE-family HTH domain